MINKVKYSGKFEENLKKYQTNNSLSVKIFKKRRYFYEI